MTAAGPAEAWALMHRFVEDQDRRGELAEALGFRLGGGRGKVLLLLREGPRTLKELAGSIGTDAPYATLVVDKLEAQGLVARRPHPDDRRRKLVELTASGVSAVETVETILRRPPAAVAALPADDLAQLTRLLTRLVQAGAAPGDQDGRPPGS